MKQQISPAVATVIIVLIVAVVGFFVWRGVSQGPGTKSAGEAGNPSPFSPGGEMVGKGGGKPAEAAGSGPGAMRPGAPR